MSQHANPAGSIGAAGEFEAIREVTAGFAQGPDILVGPGDDAAVVRVAGGEVVASVDLLVQGRHFRTDWSTAEDIGHKAAAENLSDLNAMGARPIALLVGLATPAATPMAWIREFSAGLAAEAASVGASVVGGDLSEAEAITIAITVLGVCEHGVVRRSGAQPGDIVALAGRQGWAAAGFAVLGRGFRSPRAVVDAHRRPQPPYDAGPQAAALGATAMIDVSDGLLQDLGHIADASGVAINVRSDAFELADPLIAVGAALVVDPVSFVLTGGDDYSLVACFPNGTKLPAPWRVIGDVARPADDAAIVTVDGSLPDLPPGHQHFR